LVATENTIIGATFYSGSIADVKTIEPSIDDCIPKIQSRNINLTGDKGYISRIEMIERLKNKGITQARYKRAKFYMRLRVCKT